MQHVFTSRFSEISRDEINLTLFANPFALAVEVSTDDCQMELIELQAEMETMRRYYGNSLVNLCNI